MATTSPLSSLRSALKPWDGLPIAVPNYLRGMPVISAIRVPTSPGEKAHQWVAILLREDDETLIVYRVANVNGAWDCLSGHYDIKDYQRAYGLMIEMARVDQQMAAARQQMAYDDGEM